jgi:hypothetical protein
LKLRWLSRFTAPSFLDEKLGFADGYPLVLVFGRDFYCPRDRQQVRQLVRFRSELGVNSGIGMELGLLSPATVAALVVAGPLSMVLFPLGALTIRRPGKQTIEVGQRDEAASIKPRRARGSASCSYRPAASRR